MSSLLRPTRVSRGSAVSVASLLELLEGRSLMSGSFQLLDASLLPDGNAKRGTILVKSDRSPSGSNLAAGGTTTQTTTTTSSSLTGAFDVKIIPGAGLQSNAAALAAFERAAAAWEAKITDPVTININADLSNLGSTSTIGQTSSVQIQDTFTKVRNAMVTDAADETDDAVVGSLPTAGSFILPSTRFSYNGKLSSTKAGMKALGFTGLDTQFGATDATITFNSQFAFDYDRTNGTPSNQMDFETVAIHEIGHALGFVSMVDTVDYYARYNSGIAVPASTLDMFRFEKGVAGRDPASTANFSSYARSLRPNVSTITDALLGWETAAAENAMSTGAYTGDGRQASHWKDGDLTGNVIGILDPTLGYSQVWGISDADWRALDLIGWDITPGPIIVNTAPTAANDSAATDEDTVLTVAAPGVLANDSDADGDVVTAVAATLTSANGGGVTINADGSYSYDPTSAQALQNLVAGSSVADTFSYSVIDGQGGTASATVTINVSGVEDAPPPLAPKNLAVASDGSTSRLNLTWIDASTDESGFRIQRSKSADFGSGVTQFTVASDATSFGDTGLSANTTYYYRVLAFNSLESSAVTSSGKTQAAFNNSANPGKGVTGTYYASTNFTNKKTTRTDATINFNWGSGKPVNGVSSDNFTVRWMGQILPAYDEAYTLYAKADDNVRVWIDDPSDSAPPALVIRRWGSANTSEFKTDPIELQAGHRYNIQVDYRERSGGASVALSWASKSVAKQIIPQSQLYTHATLPAVAIDPNGEAESPKIGIDNGNGSSSVTAPAKKANAAFSRVPVGSDLRDLLSEDRRNDVLN